MKNYFGLIALMLLLMVSCNSNKKQIEFSGEMKEIKDAQISLFQVFPDDEVLLDATTVKKGKFKLVGKIDKNETAPSFYKIVLDKTNYILTVAAPGENLYFKIDSIMMVKSYRVKGGNDAILMSQLSQQLKLFTDSVMVLENKYRNDQYNDSLKAAIETIYMGYVNNHTQFLKSFIRKNPTSLTTITAFYQKFNRRSFIPEKENIPLLKEIVSNLESKYSNQKDILYIKTRIQKGSSSQQQ